MSCLPLELSNAKLIRPIHRDVQIVEANKQRYVRKVFSQVNRFISHSCLVEVDTLNILRDMPNIIQFKGLCIQQSKFLMFKGDLQTVDVYMEECLADATRYRNIDPNPQQTVVKLLQDIARAMYICEQCNIVHHDIKPDNILIKLDSNKQISFILTDFDVSGMANQFQFAGSENYIAPELVCKGAIRDTYAHDYFSLGITAYTYLMKISPITHKKGQNICSTYKQMYGSHLERDLQKGNAHGNIDVSAIHGWVDDLTYNIITTLCSYNPTNRCSPSKILKMYDLPLPDMSVVAQHYPPIENNLYRTDTIAQCIASEMCARYLSKTKGDIVKLFPPAWHIAKLRLGDHMIPHEYRSIAMNILKVLDYQVFNPRLTSRIKYMSK